MEYPQRNLEAKSIEDILRWIIKGEVELDEASELLDIALQEDSRAFRLVIEDEKSVEFTRHNIRFSIGAAGLVGAQIYTGDEVIPLQFSDNGIPQFSVRPTGK